MRPACPSRGIVLVLCDVPTAHGAEYVPMADAGLERELRIPYNILLAVSIIVRAPGREESHCAP